MKKFTLFLNILALLFAIFGLYPLAGQETEVFKPGGKPEARVFTSFSTTFSDGMNHTRFDLGRAYFGYSYNFSKNLSGRIVYDVADPSVGKLKFTGMLKFGYLRYQAGKLAVTGGMIPLPEYDYGDKKWGYRYVYKPSHDEYGFGVAADLGISVSYNIATWITVDATLMNGEGYKLNEADSTLKAAAGIILLPVENLSLRAYFDKMGKTGNNQQTLELIVAYENKSINVSGAYNYQKNHSMKNGHDYHAFSVNGTFLVNKSIKVYGRIDNVTSATVANNEDPWNLSKDGQLFLAGIEFALAPGVNISPNFQGWKPADSTMPFISRFLLSLDLKL